MERLFEILFQHHPEFVEEIEGISEEEIAVLDQIVPFPPMPDEYKVFR